MVNILVPGVAARTATYVKVANFPGLYRHARSGRYYACKKLGGIRRERSLGTCDRKIAERRMKDWLGSLDKVDAEVEKTTLGQLIERFVKVTGGMEPTKLQSSSSSSTSPCSAGKSVSLKGGRASAFFRASP